MRRMLMLSLTAVLMVSGVANAAAPAAAPLKTEDDKTFYALGASIGKGLSVFSLSKSELELVQRGLTDSVTGSKLEVNIEEYAPKLEALARSRSEVAAKAEQKKGQEFADKVSKEKGATRTASGLVFKSLKAGTGATPAATDTVKVHYRGTLIDGTEFDSSIKRGQPAEFPLNGVIPCWTEGVQKMKVGGKAQLICPSAIAYGDRGRPPMIPGGATLVFEIDLLDVVSKEPAQKAPQAPAPKK